MVNPFFLHWISTALDYYLYVPLNVTMTDDFFVSIIISFLSLVCVDKVILLQQAKDCTETENDPNFCRRPLKKSSSCYCRSSLGSLMTSEAEK